MVAVIQCLCFQRKNYLSISNFWSDNSFIQFNQRPLSWWLLFWKSMKSGSSTSGTHRRARPNRLNLESKSVHLFKENSSKNWKYHWTHSVILVQNTHKNEYFSSQKWYFYGHFLLEMPSLKEKLCRTINKTNQEIWAKIRNHIRKFIFKQWNWNYWKSHKTTDIGIKARH